MTYWLRKDFPIISVCSVVVKHAVISFKLVSCDCIAVILPFIELLSCDFYYTPPLRFRSASVNGAISETSMAVLPPIAYVMLTFYW